MSKLLLSSLSLFPATPAQVIESRKRTFPEWGHGMSLEEYLKPDSDNHEYATNHRLITWVLAKRDERESLDFLCSCETYRRDGLILQKTSSSSPNVPENEVLYSIASVFTPPQNRSKGYARHMMRLLHWVLATLSSLPESFPVEWGMPPARVSHSGDAVLSVLYSDVGPEFYKGCGMLPDSSAGTKESEGWVIQSPVSTTFEVPKGLDIFLSSLIPTEESVLGGNFEGEAWEWLDETRVREMWDLDAEIMKLELQAREEKRGLFFTFLPDKGVAKYQHLRLKFFWEQMDPKPVYWGISKKNGFDQRSLDVSTFVSWTIDVRPGFSNSLIVTRLRVGKDDFKELLKEVLMYAKYLKVETVEIWNMDEGLEEEARAVGGMTKERSEHLPSFKVYGKGGDGGEISKWCFNEKFCWC